jgi:hypothetical protein
MTISPVSVPAEARAVASELAALFTKDQELARRLNDAQSRLRQANARLWTGLHPDALGLLYDATAATAIQTDAPTRSEVVAAMRDQRRAGGDRGAEETAALVIVQEIHWTVHRAFVDYQSASEERRQLAAQVGELGHRLVDALTAAGWMDSQARTADVHHLAQEGSDHAT